MSYQRKQKDKKKYKKLFEDCAGWWPAGVYKAQKPNRGVYYKRYWKSQGKHSCWAWNKKQSHKKYRRFVKENNYFTKKAYDLWWSVW